MLYLHFLRKCVPRTTELALMTAALLRVLRNCVPRTTELALMTAVLLRVLRNCVPRTTELSPMTASLLLVESFETHGRTQRCAGLLLKDAGSTDSLTFAEHHQRSILGFRWPACTLVLRFPMRKTDAMKM